MIDEFNEVTVETLEVDGDQQRIAHWLIPATLPFNQFIEMVASKAESKGVHIGIEHDSVMAFRERERKFMNLN